MTKPDTTAPVYRTPAMLVATLVMSAWALAVVLPFIWALSTSARLTSEIVQSPFGLPRSFVQALPENYRNAWFGANFSAYFLNSLLVVIPTMVLILVVALPAAYTIARFRNRLTRLLLIFFLMGLMVPGQLLLVPLFFQYTDWSQTLTQWAELWFGANSFTITLHNSHFGLILIYVALSLPFTIFILVGFFRTLPTTLYEAGIIDGCTEDQVFWHIMLPLAKPGIITISIFNFMGAWNEYFYALVFISDESLKTLPLGLAAISVQTSYEFDLGMQFAALSIVMLPTLVIYILLQKQLTQGITLGAIKG